MEQRLQSQIHCRGRNTRTTSKEKEPVIRVIDATLNLQQKYDMYINGEVASDYDEENPLTCWASVQYRFPLLGRLLGMFYAVWPLPRNWSVTFHTPDSY